eukprot:jgi/Undpi1/8666/HiC_scaffold_25.g11131.m1
MAGTVSVTAMVMMKVENGMSGIFAHGQQIPGTTLAIEEHTLLGEGATARRTLRTEVESPSGVKFVGRIKDIVGGSTSPLPQCYSSPAADPSKGSWRACEHGMDESPTDMVNWSYSQREFGRSPGCSQKWAEQHPGERPMPFSIWEADNCFLDTVTADKFCRVMEGRKGLLFVGDSLTRLMSTTLASTLRAEGIVAGSDQRCHDEWLACNGTLKMHYQRNDFLDTRTERTFENNTRGFDQKHCERPDLSKTRCTIFADDDTLSGFDTLVVNSGAHPRPGERYGPAMEVASRTIAASMKRLHGDDDTILIVRNTVPGHSDCNDRMFEGPVDLDVALALVDAAPESYKFSTFHDNNKLLEDAFLRDPKDGWRLIDSYTPTVLRPDLHIGGNDCLHYCIPGPTDHWVRLLYNMLLVATGNDAGREP